MAANGAANGRMITTNISNMEDDIWSEYSVSRHTIYDIYFYKGSNRGIMQGHRAVVFIGTDDEVYILDPIRGLRGTKPQILSDHFVADRYNGYTMYISRLSYTPADHLKTLEEYYDIDDTVSLTKLINDDVADVRDTSMIDDDVTLVLTHPLRLRANTDYEIIMEVGALITIKDAKTLM